MYELNRDKYQQPFMEFLESNGFDSYGYVMDNNLEKYIKTEYGTEYQASDTSIAVDTVLNEGMFSHAEESDPPETDGEYWVYNKEFFYLYYDMEDRYYKAYDQYMDSSFYYHERLDEWLNDNHYKSVDDIPPGFIIPSEISALEVEEPNKARYKVVRKMLKVVPKKVHNHYFDNGTFLIRPYYWGECQTILNKPNFIYYPGDFKLYVYKYFIRGNSCNKRMTQAKFNEMLEDCKKSLQKGE